MVGNEADTGWEVSLPAGGSRIGGVNCAAFHDRSGTGLDMQVLPQPLVTVVIGFDDDMLTVDGPSGRRRLGSLVSGPFPGRVRVRGDRIECLELQLSPVVAPSLLGVHGAELDGVVGGLDEVWGRSGVLLREQLAASATWPERFAVLDRFLMDRHAGAQSVDPEVAAAWQRLVRHGGRVRVGDLASDCGWSRKRLWSRFTAQLGLTPKRAAMLIRFDRAVHRLRAGLDPSVVAVDCGYADQSHLHRDFQAFAGCTPGALTV